jgi:plasmid maintenance system antidote protein VapI
MVVKDGSDVVKALGRAESALREATVDLERTRASVLDLVTQKPGITVAELASQFHLSEDAVVAFVQTVGELLGEERSLTVAAAQRGALLAAAGQAWENELGPLLGTADVRELLGVSRQRVDELLRSKRLIALPDSAGRRRYPAFQFHDGQPLRSLIAAFWTIADAAISPWTAASWCTAPDEDALEGLSPVAWARGDRDADQLARAARQDAARLNQ